MAHDQLRKMLDTHPRKDSIENRAALEECLAACFECHETCSACADACLGEETVAPMVACIRLNLDCATICLATGEVLLRQTAPNEQVRHALVQACLDACEACAAECGKHGEKMAHCKVCAESCRRCAEACRKLTG
jgi:hypothetical protein